MAEKTLTSEPEFKKRYDLNNMTNIEFENFVDENYNEYGDFHGEGLIRDRVLTFDDHAPEDEKWTNQLTGEKAQTNWELAESYGLIGWQSGASDYFVTPEDQKKFLEHGAQSLTEVSQKGYNPIIVKQGNNYVLKPRPEKVKK